MNNGAAKHEDILRRLTERLGRIQLMFSVQASSEFLNLTLNSIQSAVNKLSANFDSDQSNYLGELLEEILLTNSEPVVSFEDRIEDVLWLLDFNSRPFFLYLIKRTSSRGQNEETIAGKLELLAFELKKVNQKVNDRSVRFTEKYPGLQDIVSNWLTEEINFLRTKQRLVNSTAHPDKIVANDFKIS